MARGSALTLLAAAAAVLSLLVTSGVAQYDHLRATLSRCSGNAVCPDENMVCNAPGGFCMCKPGFVFLEDSCVTVAHDLGGACMADVQCEVTFGQHAECRLGDGCRCEEGSHYAEYTCHRSALLGEKCSSRSDCYSTSGASVYCIHSKCECHQEHHPNLQKNDCLPDVLLGGNCTRDDDCVAEAARCYNSCSCQAGFVPAEDRRRCLKVAHELGAPCEVTAQCLQFLPLSACRAGACGCEAGSHVLEARCWRSRQLGEICEDWRQCVTSSSMEGSVTCDTGGGHRCRCSPGFTITPDRKDCKLNAAVTISQPGFIILFSLLFAFSSYKIRNIC